MPLPKPRKDESHEDFISRCHREIAEEFDDATQRHAVCEGLWRDEHGESPPSGFAPGDTTRCALNMFGIWAIEPLWFTQAVEMFKAGHTPVWGHQVTAAVRERRAYDMHEHTAIIPIAGPLTKGDSKFGGTSTVRTRHMLRQAVRDPEVAHILLQVYSPGGHVDGVQDLADEVYRIRGQKPIVAHIEDLGASAAYWVASQADRITANGTAEVGSIGTMAVLEDSSKRLERLGITVHVVATGPYKGLGVEGAPVSAEALGYVRQRVEAINAHFLHSIQRGRGLTADGLALVSDGRVHHAAPAARLGLVDAVQDLDRTLAELQRGDVTVLPRRHVAEDRFTERARVARQKQGLRQQRLVLTHWEKT